MVALYEFRFNTTAGLTLLRANYQALLERIYGNCSAEKKALPPAPTP